jgi:uncharacterized glyoxalase superfamily protein PhnB
MLRNRSVPADIILPHITCREAGGAAAWLTRTFGFTELYRYGDPAEPSGVMMRLGPAYVMLNAPKPHTGTPAQLGHTTQCLTIFVEGVDAHYEHTRSVGAEIVEHLHETEYGERQYGVRDPDGHLWLFSRHARDVNPAEWGATLAP